MIRTSTRANMFLICGGVFTFVGTLFVIISMITAANMDYVMAHGRGDVRLLPVIFAFVGGVSAVTGITLLTVCVRKARMKRRLIQRGEYVLAEITGIPYDYSVRINGWPTFRVECSYQDPGSGVVYLFRSEALLIDPSYYITQSSVRVFVDRDSDYRHYYVDIDSILPEIKRR